MPSSITCAFCNTHVKNLLKRPAMSFLFKNYSLVKVMYLLIRCNKTRFFLGNTNNTNRNGVNKQNTHTHTHIHTHTHTHTHTPNTQRNTIHNHIKFIIKYSLKTQFHLFIKVCVCVCVSDNRQYMSYCHELLLLTVMSYIRLLTNFLQMF